MPSLNQTPTAQPVAGSCATGGQPAANHSMATPSIVASAPAAGAGGSESAAPPLRVFTGPAWLMHLAGLMPHADIHDPADAFGVRTFLAYDQDEISMAEAATTRVQEWLAGDPPSEILPATIAALRTLAAGPHTIWTHEAWCALPGPTLGLCVRFLVPDADRWGFAILTPKGRRAIAAKDGSHD